MLILRLRVLGGVTGKVWEKEWDMVYMGKFEGIVAQRGRNIMFSRYEG